MKVDVIIAAGDVRAELVSGKAVAVIDVFRATSVIINALYNGAVRVVPVVTVEEAIELRNRFGKGNCILGGERDTKLIDGFDKDNSPLAYAEEDVRGRTIIFTTTNGTRAIYNSRAASAIYVAAFINLSAACAALASTGRNVVIVCSGSNDRFTAEDGLCAGAVVDQLVERYGFATTDMAEVIRDMYAASKHDLKGRLDSTEHYNFMKTMSYFDDIDFCLQHDIYDIVPQFDIKQGEIHIDKDGEPERK